MSAAMPIGRYAAPPAPMPAADEVLPGPFGAPPSPDGVRPSPATSALVAAQIDALLAASPAYLELPQTSRKTLRRDLTKVASYAAELLRDEFYHSLRIGQRPVLKLTAHAHPASTPAPKARGAVARAQSGDVTRAANQIGNVTRATLQAISFPTFVADLIRGTFNSVVQSSIQQMEAYVQLLENVSRTVDQYMDANITDLQARDWLAQRYPDHITIQRDGEDGPRAVPAEGADERPPPSFRTDLGLTSDVSLDESTIEETLVPAARRQLAQSRHRLLATMVLMGIQRIVVTSGRIKATMNFHIDTSDTTQEQRATDFDTRVAAAGSFGFGPWSASLSASVAYVSSTRSQSTSEMNVSADLTSEVELRFKSDYFPLERFVDGAGIRQIQSATAVPDANAPSAGGGGEEAPSPNPAPRPEPRPRVAPEPLAPLPAMRPVGELPPAPQPPVAPTAPTVPERPRPPSADPPAANADPPAPNADTPAPNADTPAPNADTPAPNADAPAHDPEPPADAAWYAPAAF